jgi:antitoxin component YwqK of YwqJK toxin-antitoxin module
MLLKNLCFIFLFNLSTLTVFAQYFEIIKQQYVDFEEKPSRSNKAPFYMDLYRKDTIANPYWVRKIYYNDTIEGIIASVGKCKDAKGQIREGAFIYYYKNGAKKSEGNYVNNFKEGEWSDWNELGKSSAVNHYKKGKMIGRNMGWHTNGTISDSTILDENGNGKSFTFYEDGAKNGEGNYALGDKIGPWLYYYSNVKNQKSIEVTYEMDSVKTYTCFTEAGAIQKKDCIYEREANFRGGDDGWRKYLVKKLTDKSGIYSKILKPKELYTVIVRFVVSKDGNIADVKIEKTGISEIDTIALEIIQSSPKWIPAVQYNRKVNAYRRQPITFAGYDE